MSYFDLPRDNGITVFHDFSGCRNGNLLIEKAVGYLCMAGRREAR